MNDYMHVSAPTQYVDVKGNSFAYRRFGKKAGRPLIFLQYFTGTLDDWDPAVLDGLAAGREVIIFDNAGVAGSGGETPDTFAAMAVDAAAFINVLQLKKIDLLGFSIGSMVAQQLTVDHPELVHRLILVGSGPRGGEGMATYTPDVWEIFAKEYKPADEILLDTFFTKSEDSQAAGHQFLERIRSRVIDRDAAINEKVIPAQLAATAEWGAQREGSFEYLKKIRQPVLIVGGSHDIIFPTINSYLLQQNLPNAQLIIYPDSNHGAQYQYHDLFVRQVTMFLEGPGNN